MKYGKKKLNSNNKKSYALQLWGKTPHLPFWCGFHVVLLVQLLDLDITCTGPTNKTLYLLSVLLSLLAPSRSHYIVAASRYAATPCWHWASPCMVSVDLDRSKEHHLVHVCDGGPHSNSGPAYPWPWLSLQPSLHLHKNGKDLELTDLHLTSALKKSSPLHMTQPWTKPSHPIWSSSAEVELRIVHARVCQNNSMYVKWSEFVIRFFIVNLTWNLLVWVQVFDLCGSLYF